MTSSRLRELSRLASPAPWRVSDSPPYMIDGAGDSLVHYGDEIGAYVHDDDATLIVALRNDAEKYADLRDAAKALMDNVDSREKGLSGYYIDAQRFVALRAALDALDGSAP